MRRDFACHESERCVMFATSPGYFDPGLSRFLTSDNPGIACN